MRIAHCLPIYSSENRMASQKQMFSIYSAATMLASPSPSGLSVKHRIENGPHEKRPWLLSQDHRLSLCSVPLVALRGHAHNASSAARSRDGRVRDGAELAEHVGGQIRQDGEGDRWTKGVRRFYAVVDADAQLRSHEHVKHLCGG